MEFNAKEQLAGLIEWMRQRMELCGGKTAVIGISGGKGENACDLLRCFSCTVDHFCGTLTQPSVQIHLGIAQIPEGLGFQLYQRVFNG